MCVWCVVDGEMGRIVGAAIPIGIATLVPGIHPGYNGEAPSIGKSQAARFEPSLFVVWLRVVEVAHRCSRLRADRSWDPVRGWDE